MKIQAAVVREKSGPFQIAELDLADPKDDEVLVRIAGVGICPHGPRLPRPVLSGAIALRVRPRGQRHCQRSRRSGHRIRERRSRCSLVQNLRQLRTLSAG